MYLFLYMLHVYLLFLNIYTEMNFMNFSERETCYEGYTKCFIYYRKSKTANHATFPIHMDAITV